MEKIGIVVPTYNRPLTLQKVFPSFLQKGVSEIVVVDDCSRADYSKVMKYVRELCETRGVALKYKKLSQRKGAAGAKNIGITLLGGVDYVLFVDDDIMLDKKYVEICLKKIFQHDADIVGGRVIYLKKNESKKFALERSNSIKSELIDCKTFLANFSVDPGRDLLVPFVSAVALWKRSLLNKVSFFEGYKVNGYREETDPQIQALKCGAKIVFTPEAICWHLPRQMGGQWSKNLLKYEFWVIKNNWTFLNRHFDFLKEHTACVSSKWISMGYFVLHRLITNFKRLGKLFRFWFEK